MKDYNRISQKNVNSLTLELYYRGLATHKERKLVKQALATDSKVRRRYEALQDSDREIRQFVTQELNRLNIPETSTVPSTQKTKVVVGLLLAAVLLCTFIPTFLYLKRGGANEDDAIAEETEIIETISIDELAMPSEPPAKQERHIENEKLEIAEKPHTEASARKEESKVEEKIEIAEKPRSELTMEVTIIPEDGVPFAVIPEMYIDGVRLRGSDQSNEQTGNQNESKPEPNINIPPGITFIFENMFANRELIFVVIPARITSIGKDAFLGNPLVSVTIGANVTIEDNAIPGAFAAAYNANGKAAGTYTRPSVNSDAWEKK